MIFLNINVYVLVCVCAHIWYNACDIADPVVSSSTDLQGAERPKVWSWSEASEKCIRIIIICMEMFLKITTEENVWTSRCTVAFVDRDAAQTSIFLQISAHMSVYSCFKHHWHVATLAKNETGNISPTISLTFSCCRFDLILISFTYTSFFYIHVTIIIF